jgi:hypothetical protein
MNKTPAFVVSVFEEDGAWIAINDDLPIATEASTYDELVERVQEIAPEIAVLNGWVRDPEELRLRFYIETDHPIAKAL